WPREKTGIFLLTFPYHWVLKIDIQLFIDKDIRFVIINQIDIFVNNIYKINMTLQQIKYVLSLDSYRHFVKAAESCYVTQSALTIQVKKLEDEIGTALFDRSVHPLAPTPMGEQFIAKARQITRDIQALKDSFNNEYNQTEGRFK